MATEEITISELELAENVLDDMVTPVETSTETKAITLKQLKKYLGSSLPTGFIIPAVGKIDDSRFTLLDGKILSRTGTYEDFCNKVVERVQNNEWFACTEAEFSADVTNYGQCGRFVIGNDYIRIPKITRFLGATITLSEVGKTYRESLPNITGSMFTSGHDTANLSTASGAFDVTRSSAAGNGHNTGVSNCGATFDFSASRSSSTYQNNAKVQPDHTKYMYYMVVSTEGQQEEVTVDINQVYEDMELKANKNFSNIDNEGKSLASGWGMPSNRHINLTLGASGTLYTAPANGVFIFSKRGTVAGQWITADCEAQRQCYTSSANGAEATIYMFVKKGDILKLNFNLQGENVFSRFIYAKGAE